MGKIPLELARKRGARVKLLLSEHSMTQAELAEKIPCSAEHLSAVLNGKRGMTEEQIDALLAANPMTIFG